MQRSPMAVSLDRSSYSCHREPVCHDWFRGGWMVLVDSLKPQSPVRREFWMLTGTGEYPWQGVQDADLST
jgi:hypothetical protein